MAARVELHIEDSELENEQDNHESDSGSDISVSIVNTEDLSDLSFSENEDDGIEIGWSHDDSPVNVAAFILAIGATSTVPEDSTAKDFFCFFVPELFENIVDETNQYARQCIARKPDVKWYETNVTEMQAFFGLQIFFRIHVLPETSLYWSKNPALSVLFVRRVMTRDRFDKLNQYLHLNNNENFVPHRQPNHNKLFKVCPFLEAVVKNFHEEYRLKQNLSVDEAMVGFKGQLSMKQYLPLKPVKHGIKIWECADSLNGYICNLQVYTAKQDGGVTEQGLGYRVVCVLMEPFLHKYHHVFCDNFFTSIPLACDLLREQTYLCGTIRSNRHGLPASLSLQNAEVKALRKGESKFCHCGNLVASVWKDTKLVSFLSTQWNPVGDDHVNRKQQDGSVIQVPTVPAAVSYNKNMGGVDLNDQHHKYYSVGRKSRKWWQYLLWFLIDVSIVNAHILQKEALNHSSRSQMYFRLELAKMLVSDFSSRLLSVSDGRNTDGHWPEAATKGRCKRCLKRKVVKFCRLSCTSCDKQIC